MNKKKWKGSRVWQDYHFDADRENLQDKTTGFYSRFDYSHAEVTERIANYLADGGVIHHYASPSTIVKNGSPYYQCFSFMPSSKNRILRDLNKRRGLSETNREDLKSRKKYLAEQLAMPK